MGDISRPMDKTFTVNGQKVTLKFSQTFGSNWSDKFNKAQAFVDSEVLRYDDPLIPKQTGNLIKSGTLGTKIGSGEVRYIAPYAHTQYYDTATTRWYDHNRGAKWFERMKTAHLSDIKRGLKKYLDNSGLT